MELLTAEHIFKAFGEKKVLRDVSIRLEEGELLSLLGVSGGGKTTLFNILSGIDLPDSGKVTLRGEDITGRPGKVSYMLQKDLLPPYRKVIDSVALPLLLKGASKAEARRQAEAYFDVFGLAGTQLQYPDALSGGMKQRAALLRTYLSSDGVALLDEPFSALDMITKSKMYEWYLDVMDQIRLSTIFITHDIDEAVLLSDRVCILSEGRVTESVVIDAPKPRPKDFSLTVEFLDYKRRIKALL